MTINFPLMLLGGLAISRCAGFWFKKLEFPLFPGAVRLKSLSSYCIVNLQAAAAWGLFLYGDSLVSAQTSFVLLSRATSLRYRCQLTPCFPFSSVLWSWSRQRRRELPAFRGVQVWGWTWSCKKQATQTQGAGTYICNRGVKQGELNRARIWSTTGLLRKQNDWFFRCPKQLVLARKGTRRMRGDEQTLWEL